MDFQQLQSDLGVSTAPSVDNFESSCVSLEAEIPETLYVGMKEFISSNPQWDQYKIMSSALANFLFQNGCEDRAVTERYLSDLFHRPND